MFKDPERHVLFREHPVTDITILQPQKFDICAFREGMVTSFISSGKFINRQYCTCLIYKIYQLKRAEIKSFLLYQCEKISDPLFWLHKLEKLIVFNWDIFTPENYRRHIEKVLSVIEVIRDRFETKEAHSKEKIFDFNELKKKIKSYSGPEKKISRLLEAKTEYLQNKPILLNPHEVPFDEKIQLEIDLINSQIELSRTTTLKKEPVSKTLPTAKINGNLNQFVDIFYRLLHEEKVGDKSFLEADHYTISEIISGCFIDKSGYKISEDTVRTILKPSRFEKRPKGEARIEIKIPE